MYTCMHTYKKTLKENKHRNYYEKLPYADSTDTFDTTSLNSHTNLYGELNL